MMYNKIAKSNQWTESERRRGVRSSNGRREVVPGICDVVGESGSSSLCQKPRDGVRSKLWR